MWSVWLYNIFPTLSHKRRNFLKKKKNTQHRIVFPFCLQNFSEAFLILRKIQCDIMTNVHRSSCTVPLFLSDINEYWNFLTDFQKIFKVKCHENLTGGRRAVPRGGADGRTDMTKVTVESLFTIFRTSLKINKRGLVPAPIQQLTSTINSFCSWCI